MYNETLCIILVYRGVWLQMTLKKLKTVIGDRR
jgi:hypothetical protein